MTNTNTVHLDLRVQELLHKHDLISLFEKESISVRVRRILTGLRSPRDSGDYKYAKLQIARLLAPSAAIVVPLLAIAVLLALAGIPPPPKRPIPVQYRTPDPVIQLEKVLVPRPDPIAMPFAPTPDISTPTVTIAAHRPSFSMSPDYRPAIQALPTVSGARSPVVMKGIWQHRVGNGRRLALIKNGGTDTSERAVILALRWLQKHQAADGSWTEASGRLAGTGENNTDAAHAPAMTALALLTFLARGETPDSEEFGPTVSRAIRWLVDHQRDNGRLGGSYEHQIAAYALSEAYAMTGTPMVKDAAEAAVMIIIEGQNPFGGWSYPLLASDPRTDTSVMAWCVQALKAARLAEMSCPGLEPCMQNGIEGFKKNWDPKKGGFGYSTVGATPFTSATQLTGAGILSMQFLGAEKAKETRAALRYLDETRPTFDWRDASWKSIYYWYYDTQARFHAGGKTWDRWNNEFAVKLAEAQTVQEGQGLDGRDIGFWTTGSDSHGLVMNTSLCALMLQVYYRYLLTNTPTDAIADNAFAPEADGIEVNVLMSRLEGPGAGHAARGAPHPVRRKPSPDTTH